MTGQRKAVQGPRVPGAGGHGHGLGLDSKPKAEAETARTPGRKLGFCAPPPVGLGPEQLPQLKPASRRRWSCRGQAGAGGQEREK